MEDTRIVKTKAKLMEALSDLSADRSFEEITVSELCRKAGVNRTTFYKYYQLPEDVGKESFERHLQMILDKMHEEVPDNTYETMLFCCREFRENFRRTKRVFPGFSVDEKTIQDFYLRLNIPEAFEDKTKLYFIASGASAVVNYWINEMPSVSPEEIAEKLTAMINSVMNA